MTKEEAYNRIDAIIAKHEIDDEYVTITSFLDYDALRTAREILEQEPCEDAISKQAALKVVEREQNKGDALSEIEKLPPVKPQEPKWIPVSERLPEFSIEVLTCSNGGFIEIQSLEDSYDGYWENQKGDWTDLEEIIAWMPLPKPYEPKKSEVQDADSN